MSILFVLLTFLVIISVNYLWFRPAQALPVTAHPSLKPPAPLMTKQAGFAIPQHYCFHPGHTGCCGFMANRLNVSITAFQASSGYYYIPKWTEFALTLATVTAAGVAFHYAVIYLEILPRSIPAKNWMTRHPATA